jgi:hypothetical protein
MISSDNLLKPAPHTGCSGIGIRIPEAGSVMSKLMRRETPAEAPAVRKISSGDAG